MQYCPSKRQKAVGCPPDPIEVSIWRSGERIENLQQKYDRMLAEYRATSALCTELAITGARPEADFAALSFQRRTDVHPTEYDQYADASDQFRIEEECKKQVKQLETALCELRTRLLQYATTAPAPALKEQLALQKELHRAHREEDRTQWLIWLKEKMDLLAFLIRDAEGDAESNLDIAASQAMLQALKLEIRRIKQIPENELLLNRDILRADQKLWRTPYRTHSGFD